MRKNLVGSSRVTLSDDRAHQILGNQKIYGLWGLYTMPARASGLVDGDPPRLTPPPLELVETFCTCRFCRRVPARMPSAIREALRPQSSRIDVSGGDATVVEAVGRVLKRASVAREREFYRFHLLYGGPQDATEGRQQQLAELLTSTSRREGFRLVDRRWSGNLAKAARVDGDDWHPLAHRSHASGRARRCLPRSSALFTHLLGLDGKSDRRGDKASAR